MIKIFGRASRIGYKLLSLIWFLNAVDCFGWTSWNNNLLQSISDCPTFDGNRTGICVASAAECRNSKFDLKETRTHSNRILLVSTD